MRTKWELDLALAGYVGIRKKENGNYCVIIRFLPPLLFLLVLSLFWVQSLELNITILVTLISFLLRTILDLGFRADYYYCYEDSYY